MRFALGSFILLAICGVLGLVGGVEALLANRDHLDRLAALCFVLGWISIAAALVLAAIAEAGRDR